MKKILLIVAIVGTAMVSCKKDRVCSCKEVDSFTPTPSVGPATIVTDYEYTITKVGYRTAFNACIHTKSSATSGSLTVTTDINCSLK